MTWSRWKSTKRRPEDLFVTYGTGFNEQKRAIESLAAGEVLVMEARGERGSGTIGDILALRAQVRGAAAIVIDGGMRDSAAVSEMDISIFHGGAHLAVLERGHVPWERDVAIGCGGTAVCRGVVVGDDDGVVVIPPDLAEELVAAVEEQERFIVEQVRAGSSVEGLYPLGARWHSAYQR